MDAAAGAAEEESRARRSSVLRPHNQRDLPGFRKVTLMYRQIFGGKKNPAPGVRMEPPHDPQFHSAGLPAAAGDQRGKPGVIIRRKNEPRPAGVLALNRHGVQHFHESVRATSQQNPTDLHASSRHGIEGFNRNPAHMLQGFRRVLQLKRDPGRQPYRILGLRHSLRMPRL